MSEPSLPEEVIEQRVAAFADVCRRVGLKLTTQRLEIFRALASSPTHPTADELHQSLVRRLPSLSLDTVYRTLNTLQEHGMVRRLAVLDDQSRYDADLTPHHHFVCVRCRTAEDVRWPELEALEPPRQTTQLGQVHQVHAELRGVCRACQQEDETG